MVIPAPATFRLVFFLHCFFGIVQPPYLQIALCGLPVNVNSFRGTLLNRFSELVIRKPWRIGAFAKKRKYIFPITVKNKVSDTGDIKFSFTRVTYTLKALQQICSVMDFSCCVWEFKSEDRMPYTIRIWTCLQKWWTHFNKIATSLCVMLQWCLWMIYTTEIAY